MRQWILGWDLFSSHVRQQILEMAVMALCGMVLGLMRTADLYFVKRQNLHGITSWTLEVLFWITGGFVAGEFLYYCAYGAVSIHGLVALAGGFFLWKRAFCQQIVTFLDAVFSGQNLTRCGIMKRSVMTGESIGEHRYGKNETKPYLQKRKRKQRHRHR